MSERPTDSAIRHFKEVTTVTRMMTPDKSDNELIRHLGWATRELAFGNEELATALRATYILLEKVDKKLDMIRR
jgi:hypothetical protein